MPEFETVGLDKRLEHLDFKYDNDRKVMASKWSARMRALRSKLQVDVARGRMSRDEARAHVGQFVNTQRSEAMKFTSEYEVERNRLRTFYQPAEQEAADPVKAYQALLSEKRLYEDELAEFNVYGSGNVVDDAWYHVKKKVPFAGGGVQVKERTLVPDGKGGQKTVVKLRTAKPDELKRWAVAEAGLQSVNRRLTDIRSRPHIAARSSGSAFDAVNTGTLGDKVTESMPKPKRPKQELVIADIQNMTDDELKRIIAGE